MSGIHRILLDAVVREGDLTVVTTELDAQLTILNRAVVHDF